MVRFIALTETPHNRTVLINVAAIVYVTKGRKEDTYIRIASGVADDKGEGLRNFYFFVKEPVEQIEKMLAPPMMAPPTMGRDNIARTYKDGPIDDHQQQFIRVL